MKKIICLLLLSFSFSVYSDITVKKILSVKKDPNFDDDSRVCEVVLTDGSKDKVMTFGKLPNNEAQAINAIENRPDIQNKFDIAKKHKEDDSNNFGSKKKIKDKLKDKSFITAEIDANFASLSNQDRKILKDLAESILELQEGL